LFISLVVRFDTELAALGVLVLGVLDTYLSIYEFVDCITLLARYDRTNIHIHSHNLHNAHLVTNYLY
jgi:hypothetical protein